MSDKDLIARLWREAAYVKPLSKGAYEALTDAADALEAATRERAAVPDAATAESERRAWAIAGHLELDREAVKAERDAALAAIERVREAHRKFTYYELEDSCPDTSEDHREERHHESDEIGEFYCEDMPTGDVVCDLCRYVDGERMDWPCPTIQALDGGESDE